MHGRRCRTPCDGVVRFISFGLTLATHSAPIMWGGLVAEPPYTHRPYQVQDLAFHMANPKSLNLSEPGTGKTPTVCVLAYYHWAKHGRKTIWAMPKSLMEKNKDRKSTRLNSSH